MRKKCGLLAVPRTVPVSRGVLPLTLRGPVAWPPRSPDRTLLDYYPWGPH